MASSDQWQMSRAFRVLTLLEEAGGDEKLETRFQSSEAMETKSLSSSAEKPQGGRSLHDWNVAVRCLSGGTIWPVANRLQAVRKHGSCWCWSGRPSSLPNHCCCDWTRRRGLQACPITAIAIGLGEEQILHSKFDSGICDGCSDSVVEIESCTTLFARCANAPIHTSVVPNTAGDE